MKFKHMYTIFYVMAKLVLCLSRWPEQPRISANVYIFGNKQKKLQGKKLEPYNPKVPHFSEGQAPSVLFTSGSGVGSYQSEANSWNLMFYDFTTLS